jgi:hypothetical protein
LPFFYLLRDEFLFEEPDFDPDDFDELWEELLLTDDPELIDLGEEERKLPELVDLGDEERTFA